MPRPAVAVSGHTEVDLPGRDEPERRAQAAALPWQRPDWSWSRPARAVLVVGHQDDAVDDAFAAGATGGTLVGAGAGLLAGLGILAIPGLGRLTVDAILRRDYPVIQGVVLLFSFVYVLVNLMIDLLYTLLDPRIRY